MLFSIFNLRGDVYIISEQDGRTPSGNPFGNRKEQSMKISKKNLAAQLFTIRDYTKTPKDIAESMKKIKAIGYDAVQISGLGPIDPKELAAILDGEGLVCCASHDGGGVEVPVADVHEDRDKGRGHEVEVHVGGVGLRVMAVLRLAVDGRKGPGDVEHPAEEPAHAAEEQRLPERALYFEGLHVHELRRGIRDEEDAEGYPQVHRLQVHHQHYAAYFPGEQGEGGQQRAPPVYIFPQLPADLAHQHQQGHGHNGGGVVVRRHQRHGGHGYHPVAHAQGAVDEAGQQGGKEAYEDDFSFH